eukprot:gene14485-6107_t
METDAYCSALFRLPDMSPRATPETCFAVARNNPKCSHYEQRDWVFVYSQAAYQKRCYCGMDDCSSRQA